MNVCVFTFPDQWAHTSSSNGYIRNSRHGHDAEGVAGCLLKDRIATHSCDGNQFNIRAAVCEHQSDGIIVPGIAVEDYLLHVSQTPGAVGTLFLACSSA